MQLDHIRTFTVYSWAEAKQQVKDIIGDKATLRHGVGNVYTEEYTTFYLIGGMGYELWHMYDRPEQRLVCEIRIKY